MTFLLSLLIRAFQAAELNQYAGVKQVSADHSDQSEGVFIYISASKTRPRYQGGDRVEDWCDF